MAKKSPLSPAAALGLTDDFLWGVSTAAFQIEGAVAEDGRGLSMWDIRTRQKGCVGDGSNADIAADHYHRWQEDIGLMERLGVGAYRFSISWPRVMPRGRGGVNDKGLDFYDRLIDGLLKAKIEPWLCLYHWDLPQGLEDLGGWTNRDIAGWFADYTVLVAKRFGDRVKHFATFNEPNVSTLFGYGMTNWSAPGANDPDAYFRAAHHLNLSHGAAVQVLRDHVPGCKIGAVHNRQTVYPEDGADNTRGRDLLDAHWNHVFPDPQIIGHYPAVLARDFEPYIRPGDLASICHPLDYFGLNHYGPIFARDDASVPLGFVWGNGPPGEPHPDLGWTIYPEEFRKELVLLQGQYGLPIYVTENGCGSDREKIGEDGKVHDKHRISYLTAYISQMIAAARQGVDVRGYFVWSLTDCFEWGSGLNNRFGLVFVDYENGQRRVMKDSGEWYAGLISGEHGV